jgi:hypothetical protein
MGDHICECEGHEGLFIWRGDPQWWSCAVRPLTDKEKTDHAEAVAASGQDQPS